MSHGGPTDSGSGKPKPGRKLTIERIAAKLGQGDRSGDGVRSAEESIRDDAERIDGDAPATGDFASGEGEGTRDDSGAERSSGFDSLGDRGSESGGSGGGSGGSGGDDGDRTGSRTADSQSGGRTQKTSRVLGAHGRQNKRVVKAEKPPRKVRSTATKQIADEEAAKKELEFKAGILGGLIKALSYPLVKSRGPHWRLNDQETEDFSTALTIAIDSSFPGNYLKIYNELLEKFGPWLAVVTTGYTIIEPRLAFEKHLAAKEKAARAGSGMPQGEFDTASTGSDPGVDQTGTDGYVG